MKKAPELDSSPAIETSFKFSTYLGETNSREDDQTQIVLSSGSSSWAFQKVFDNEIHVSQYADGESNKIVLDKKKLLQHESITPIKLGITLSPML